MEIALSIGSLGSAKIREGIKSRRHEGEKLRNIRSKCNRNNRVIIHCSSAGELESAIPLINDLSNNSDVDILLSIYSTSAGHRAEKIKNLTGYFYMPFDSKRRVKRLLNIIEPSFIVIVKHDIWPNLVWECEERGIPAVLINGNFRPDSSRLKPLAGGLNRAIFSSLQAIYAVAEDDASRFKLFTAGSTIVEAPGDTRYDRVRQRAIDGHADQGKLHDLLENNNVAVAGSTWPEDEKRLIAAWTNIRNKVSDAILILVPHEPSKDHLKSLEAACQSSGIKSVRLSELEGGLGLQEIVIVDKMGILAGLYGLGKIAYVGGGFGTGVHSVLEPAVFGLPVLFGPRHLMSHEARTMIQRGIATAIDDENDIMNAISDALTNGESSISKGKLAFEFVQEMSGVSSNLTKSLLTLSGISK